MPHVKQYLQISRVTILVAETPHFDAHRRTFAVRTEPRQQKTAQRVNRVFGSVDDLIRKRSNLGHRLSFGANCAQESRALIGRMRTSCLAEAILQHVVRRFEEQYADFQSFRTQRFELFLEIAEEPAFANINHEGSATDSLLVVVRSDEASERREHRYRQIIDAEVTKVLKRVGGRGHTRPAQASDDYDVRYVVLFNRRGVFGFTGHLGGRQLYQKSVFPLNLERKHGLTITM